MPKANDAGPVTKPPRNTGRDWCSRFLPRNGDDVDHVVGDPIDDRCLGFFGRSAWSLGRRHGEVRLREVRPFEVRPPEVRIPRFAPSRFARVRFASPRSAP